MFSPIRLSFYGSATLNCKRTIIYVTIVPQAPRKVLLDKLNAEKGLIGDSAWARKSLRNNSISSMFIFFLSNLYLSK